MGEGIGAILTVAAHFSDLEGAVTNIKSASPVVLAGIVTGGLILFLWKGRGRSVGVILLAMTILVWVKSTRPTVLISEDGRMFGLMSEVGRVVNKPRGSGYAVRIWLENDGDAVTQAESASRDEVGGDKYNAIADLSDGWRVYLYLGDDAEVAAVNCTEKTILVTSKLSDMPRNCIAIDKNYLRGSGAISIDIIEGIPVLKHSRDAARNRPWGY